MTRTGAAFIEDQIVVLESQSREGMWREPEECGDQRKPRREPSASSCSLASSPDPAGFFLLRLLMDAGSIWHYWQTVTML